MPRLSGVEFDWSFVPSHGDDAVALVHANANMGKNKASVLDRLGAPQPSPSL
jgi:hypothetical protein